MYVLNALLIIGLLTWLSLGILHAWSASTITMLRPGRDEDAPAALPKVSVILAARDEEAALPATLDSLLKLDYPDYEVILVDDDSTDHTGTIADEYAQRTALDRLKVIHNRERPAGWTGKVYALHLAACAAQGEWLLATDADVVHHPQTLGRAVSLARRRGLDLLSLVPHIELESFWERVVLPLFSFGIASYYPFFLINNPRFRRAAAVGAFILMRRKELGSLGGYAQINSTVIDDLRLAELFKWNGRRIYLAATRGLLRTRMYENCREVWEGLCRTSFEGLGFSVARVLAVLVLIMVADILPWATVLTLAFRDVWAGHSLLADSILRLAFSTCLTSALVYLPFLIVLRVSPLYVFTLPLGAAFYAGVAVDSMLVSIFRAGVRWKGRHYPPPV
jgi:hopene-associated glycosyltransferase HpnB